MVVKRQCSFCAREIEPGTGMIFVKRDGTVFHFCTSSCRKQQLHLHRVGHHFKWTRAHELKRAADHASTQQRAAAAAAAPKTSPRARRASVPETPEPAKAPEATAASPAAAPAVAEAKEAPASKEPPATPPSAKKPRRPPRKKAEAPAAE